MPRIWKFGSDVDTDQIVPGRYAPYIRPNEDVGQAAFIEARPDFARSAQPGDVIVAGSNFGCGSSREYAALALHRRQIAAIIAASYARIFYRNALNLGIPVYVAPEIVAAVEDGEPAAIDILNQRLSAGNRKYPLPPLPAFARAFLEEGGAVAYVRKYGRFPGEA